MYLKLIPGTKGFYASENGEIYDSLGNLDELTVNHKDNRMRLINDWWFAYMTEANSIRLKSIIGVQTNIDSNNAS